MKFFPFSSIFIFTHLQELAQAGYETEHGIRAGESSSGILIWFNCLSKCVYITTSGDALWLTVFKSVSPLAVMLLCRLYSA